MKGFAMIVWLGLAGVASFALFNITFKVEQLQDQLNTLNKQILEEQRTVHVLQAEWSYLSRPSRIETLSLRQLPHLRPPTAQQVGNIESLMVGAAATVSPSQNATTRIRPATVRGAQ